MKNLTKIFMAVVALFAVSCTTDMTDDLAPELGLGEGQATTTLTLSLEESRTQLGEKVDGFYKLLWSENDAIAVNGAVSEPLTAEQAGTASASFSFAEPGVTRPFCVVYPAPAVVAAEEATEGDDTTPTATTVYPVTFLATQSWANGTFCEGAAPMYGYAVAPAEDEEAAPVQMQHLTGVLRIAPKGNVTLTSLVVSAQTGSIAGDYTVDCTNGTLTPVANTSNTVTVSFGEGLALKADEATPIYVTVPAGSYGTFLVTLHTATDKMTVKFNSDVKPIAVGKVREFTEFDYAPNTLDTDNGEFLIESKEDLIEFARIASTFYPRATAKVTATEPIDMTGYDWKPIEGFGPYTFDGGEVEIKGLNAPLFAETYATIKNVRLTDVALVGDDVKMYGAIAYSIANGALINCSASGELTYNLSDNSLKRVGGLVGMLDHCEFTGCTNNVNIIVNGAITESNDSLLHLGGVAGWVQNPQCKIENSTNYGTITINGSVDRTNIGGFLGYCDAAAEIDLCYNRGEMLLAAHLLGGAFSTFTGFIGSLDAGFDTENPTCKITNCENHGDVTFGTKGGDEGIAPTAGKATYYTHIGGFLGYTRDVNINYFNLEMTSCKNYGDVSINALDADSYLKASGLISQLQADLIMSSCSNNGKIGVYKGATNGCHIGSLIAHIVTLDVDNSYTTISNTTNEGDVYVGAITHDGIFYFGGLTGYIQYTNLDMSGVHNNGTIDVNNTATTNNLYQGGFFGYVHSSTRSISLDDCSNKKNITFNSDTQSGGNAYTGGIIGYNGATENKKFNKVKNNGDITFTGAATRIPIGGLIGASAKGLTLTSCSNEGDITYEDKDNNKNATYFWLGGLVGAVYSSHSSGADMTQTLTATTCSNGGTLTIKNATVVTDMMLGGIFAGNIWREGNKYACNYELTDCTNTDDLVMTESSGGSHTHIGGILGACYANAKQTTTIKNPVNSGNITTTHTTGGTPLFIGGVVAGFSGNGNIGKNDLGVAGSVSGSITVDWKTAGNYPSIGGLVGISNSTGTIEDVNILSANENKVDVTFETSKNNMYVGGFVGYINAKTTFKNLTNARPINVTYKEVTNLIHISGAFGRISGAITATKCSNSGAITANITKSSSYIMYGGFCAYANVAIENITECLNSGAASITIDESTFATADKFSSAIGGSFGWFDSVAQELSGLSNTGDLSVTIKSAKLPAYIGGVYGYASSNIKLSNSTNEGAVSFTADNNTVSQYIGGITGATLTESTFDTCSNSGAVSFTADNNTVSQYIGGITGATLTESTFDTCSNSGAVSFNVGTCSMNPFIGGVIGQVDATSTCTSCSNSGAVSFNVGSCSAQSFTGGVVGYINKTSTFENCSSSGTVTITPTGTGLTAELCVGGFVGRSSVVNAVNKCYNEGAITLQKGSYYRIYLGGMIGDAVYNNTADDDYGFDSCYNKGTITLETGVAATNNIRMGGFTGYYRVAYDTNIANYGDINVGATSKAQILLGGVYGYSGSAYVMNGGYTNTGNITITGGTGTATNFATAVGGIVGVFYNGVEKAVNTGNITMSGDGNKDYCTFGGIVGFSYGKGTVQNCKSYCNIKADDYKYVGWIVAGTRVENVNTSNVNRTAHVRNCQLGGVKMEWNDETEEEKEVSVFDGNNFMKYIYSDRDNTEVDGCTYSKTKPTITYLYETNNAQ